MKRRYFRPTTETVKVEIEKYVMVDNSEPEITYNIGAKENNMLFDWDEDTTGDYDLWNDEDEE